MSRERAIDHVRSIVVEGPLPEHPSQQTLDEYRCKKLVAEITEGLDTTKKKAVFLASKDNFSSAWLRALPSAQIGTLMDPMHFRMACGIRIGSAICHRFKCRLCNLMVDPDGLYPLSYTASSGRAARHSKLKNVLKRSLRRAKIASSLEPNDLIFSNSLSPDGITIPPWAHGKSLIWDVTVSCTAAESYLDHTSHIVGWAAEHAAKEKCRKYVAVYGRYFLCRWRWRH